MSKAAEVLNGIIERFRNNDIPKAIAYTAFPILEVPASKWSLLNRTLIFFSGTADARGFRQWQEVNRFVKKGSRAIYILAPRLKKKDNEETALIGFLAVPVFRYEDTDGEPVPHSNPVLPKLPLMEVAEEWGISVKAVPGNYEYLGFYSDQRKEIGMATENEEVFFHELCHAAHYKVSDLKPGPSPIKEIVAELGSNVLCYMVGKTPVHLGNSYRCIEEFAKKINLTTVSACLKVFSEVEKVINLIMGRKNVFTQNQRGFDSAPLPDCKRAENPNDETRQSDSGAELTDQDLQRLISGKRFRLSCGHRCTVGHNLANTMIICSQGGGRLHTYCHS